MYVLLQQHLPRSQLAYLTEIHTAPLLPPLPMTPSCYLLLIEHQNFQVHTEFVIYCLTLTQILNPI